MLDTFFQSIIQTPTFGVVAPIVPDSPVSPAGSDDKDTVLMKEDPNLITTAVFYSITSTQKGMYLFVAHKNFIRLNSLGFFLSSILFFLKPAQCSSM